MTRDQTSLPPAQDPHLQNVPTIEGHKVLGKIVLLAPIGEGGMGVVYRGWHMAFRIDVAVKVLKPALASDRDYVRRFRHEAQAALKITHQNVVRAYDVEERHGLHYFVMEFVDGESAWQRIGRLGKMPALTAQTLLLGGAAGLAEAHAHGLVHRDIKPGNLLIAHTGRVKLADLGLVRPAVDPDDAADQSERSAMLGTPQYIAPEQWAGAAPQPTADVWALGATLYYLVTGRHGMPRMPSRELRQWVRDNPFPTLDRVLKQTPELDRIFERCVHRDPSQRFATAVELHQALLALGPGDESLLRDADHQPVPLAQVLPPNEVLGRIDMQLKQPEAAAVAPVVRRRAPVAARRVPVETKSSNTGLVMAVLVVAAIVVVGIVVYVQSGRRVNDASTSETGALTPTTVDDATPTPRQPPMPAPDTTPPPVPVTPPPDVAPPPKTAMTNERPAPPPPAARPSAVEAAAEESPPVAVSPRETLQAWLAHSGDAGHLDYLPRHSDAFVLSQAQAGGDAQAISACLASLDEGMHAFPQVTSGSVPAAAVDQLLAMAAALRQRGSSIEPLLPYLLLLQKNDAADPGVAFCVFEAWAVEALDLRRARTAADDLQALLATVADSGSPSRARLPEVVFELGTLGDDGTAMLARVVRKLVAERLDVGALGPLAVRQAFAPELEAAYEKAMQAGDFDRAARDLQTLLACDPEDRACEVLLAVVLGHRDDVSFDFATLVPEQQAAITERARHLGLDQVAPQMDVPGVLSVLADASTANLSFFAVGLDLDLKQTQAEVARLKADIDTTQRERFRLKAEAENAMQRAANYKQRNPTASERARQDGIRLYGEAAAAGEKVQQLRKEHDEAKAAQRQLEKGIDELGQRRREFRLR